MTATRVTKSDIVGGLRSVGVSEGQVLFAHSSLSAFGHVEGAADAVIDALLEAVAPGGTVVVPTFTWGMFHERDSADVTFDMLNTHSSTGRIPEVFRKRPEAIRSEHVCHSVAAIGPHARDVMGDGVHPFDKGGTFDRLYRLDARYLLLGVGFRVCTALHAVEERMQVPYRYYRDFVGATVIRSDGRRVPSRSVEFLRYPGYGNCFAKMRGVFEEAGILRTARVGEATVTAARIRDIIDAAAKLVAADPYYLVKP